MAARDSVHGAGLGLRRALLGPLQVLADDGRDDAVDFYEVAPENWLSLGGRLGRRFRALTEAKPLVCHGLSLSLGGPAPLDETFLHRLRRFFDEHAVALYSEHLSYCADDAHLYDLMPIPFTRAAVDHVASRIARTQDVLGRRIAVENVSYYTPLVAADATEMTELDFIREVVAKADCDLLLDVNNVHVNSVNHRYDADAFLRGLPLERVAYVHVAGHYVESSDLLVDTHGAAVIPDVWSLLERAYAIVGPKPTLLERDFNFPAMDVLLAEVGEIRARQAAAPASTQGVIPAKAGSQRL